VRHALEWRCVRGVTFQPVQDAGRNERFDKRTDRIVLSDIRRRIVEDSGVFGEDDVIPLPCNPETISIAYGLRNASPCCRSSPRAARGIARAGAQCHQLREVSGLAREIHRPVLAVFRPVQRVGAAGGVPVLPAKFEAPAGLGYENSSAS